MELSSVNSFTMQINKLTIYFLTLAAFQVNAIEVHGHRGARAVLPENTLPAIEYALTVGVDVIELDTGVTSDGHVVVHHDQKINSEICQHKNGDPITKDLWIHSMSLTQIKNIDCGSRINPRFSEQTLAPGAEIPTLEEVFKFVASSDNDRSRSVKFNIETKSKADKPFAQPAPAVFADKVIDLIEKYDLVDRAIIQSFDLRTLKAAYQRNKKIERAALFYQDLEDWVTPTREAKGNIVSPHFSRITQSEVNDIQQQGLRVVPWTANSISDWNHLIDLGVDGIITDDPKPLIDLLKTKSHQ